MTTLTHPLYQQTPLADALTAYQQRLEQERIQAQQEHDQALKRDAENIAGLMAVAQERLGSFWPALEPHITMTNLRWERELEINAEMPQVWPFTITVQLDGYVRFDFPYSNLQHTKFNKQSPIHLDLIGEMLVKGHEYWLYKEEVRLAEVAKEAQEDAYIAAYRQWQHDYDKAITYNAQKLAELQQQHDDTYPYNLYVLQYALVADDEEDVIDDVRLDTRSSYVLSDEPDEKGYWQEATQGNPRLTRFFNPVKISGPEITAPSQSGYFSFFVEEAGEAFCFSPVFSRKEMIAHISSYGAQHFLPLPPAPKPENYGLTTGRLGYRAIMDALGMDAD